MPRRTPPPATGTPDDDDARDATPVAPILARSRVSAERRGKPDRLATRDLLRNHYDRQGLRIQMGNRLTQNFRQGLGQEPGRPSDELSPEAQQIIAQLKVEYSRLADGIARGNRARWQALLDASKGIITTPEELILTQDYIEMEAAEARLGRQIAALVYDFPIWKTFLADVRGVGPLLGACLIAETDITKSHHVSGLWAYAGLDVVQEPLLDEDGTPILDAETGAPIMIGKGRSRRREHLVKRPYVARDGTTQERDSITYNPWFKTKLMGVLGPSFLRSASPYRKYYDDYKARLEHHQKYGVDVLTEKGAKAHRHMMALRYMVKMFLRDFWLAWRELEGLPYDPPYHEAKLGLIHGGPPAQSGPDARPTADGTLP